MDASVGTFVLLSFLFCLQTVCAEFAALTPIQLAPIPCNDKIVEKLSRLAMTYINEDRTEGYKFALNRISSVHLHAQGPAGNVYYLDLDVLETKCHTGSPKPWKRCDVRAFMETQISGNCNTTLLHTTEGYSYLYSYDCTLVPDPPEKLQQTCPTCPILLSVDSPQAVTASRVSLDSYKQRSAFGAGLGVKKITRAAAQTLPVKVNFVEYTVQYCPEGMTERGTCQRLTAESDTETAGFCSGSVRGNPKVHPEVYVTCEMFKLQNVDVLRPVQPQGHDLPSQPTLPPIPPVFVDPVNEPEPTLSDPKLPPVEAPAPSDPVSTPIVLSEPSVAATRFARRDSSSSESSEILTKRQSSDSSSEEIGGFVARRPPISFHYQRLERRRRQALMENQPSHNPRFLSDFPSGSSPFRSCPGPARYTTV